jgi:hypothetical protein
MEALRYIKLYVKAFLYFGKVFSIRPFPILARDPVDPISVDPVPPVTAPVVATIEVRPMVMKGNGGIFTVFVSLPEGFSTQDFDLNTVTLNGVKALNCNNGEYNQAKIGHFKFNRADFNWTQPTVTVEFSGYVNGHLVIGQTTVKVQL